MREKPFPTESEVDEVERLLAIPAPVDCVRYIVKETGWNFVLAKHWMEGFIIGRTR